MSWDRVRKTGKQENKIIGEMAMVNVKVEFLGTISYEVGVKKMDIELDGNIDKAISTLNQEIGRRARKPLLYTVIINGVNYALIRKDNETIKQGDLILIVPVVAGG